jgi:pimeloyl-ACP methyl ester carboxylesterase
VKRTVYARGGLRLSAAESGQGRPFVFQHGLCGDAAQPAHVFPAEAGHRCVTLECRGHGRSEAGLFDEFSIPAFADDVSAFLKSTGMEAPVIGGISMGAAIALRLAVTTPSTIRALVLARPAWLVSDNPSNMLPNTLAGELLAAHGPDEALRKFEESDAAETLRREGPDNLASIRGFFARRPADVTAALLQRISRSGPGISEDEVRAIAVPTLVIGHGRDFVHPVDMAKRLAHWISGARFAEITPKAENPDAYRADFHAALSRFLKEL